MASKRKRINLSLTGTHLRVFGVVFLLAGCIGTTIQKNVLGVGQISNSQLLEMLETLPGGMFYATFALVCQVLEVCAVPIFALLLAEGARYTSNFKRYLLRVAGLALLCEIPYHLLMDGELFVAGSFNPVFGAVLSLIVASVFRAYTEKKPAHIAARVMAVIGGILWSTVLGVDFGGPCVILTAVFWITHGKRTLRTLLGCGASLLCGVFSPLFLFSPTAFLVIYFYNDQRGSANKPVNYLAYPVILLLAWLSTRPI